MKNNAYLRLKIIFISCLLTWIGLINGCVKQDDFQFNKIASATWSPDFAVPVVNSSLSMSDLLTHVDTSLVSIDPNHFITLVYRGNIYSMYGFQFLPVLDQSSSQSLNLTAPEAAILNMAGPVNKGLSSNYTFTMPNGEQLDSLTLSMGNLQFNMQSTVPRSGNITVSIPAAIKNGNPFLKIIPFSTASGMPISVIDNSDMTGYKMNLRATGPANTMQVDYTISFTGSAGLAVNTAESFNITCNFQSLKLAKAFGNFGTQTININSDSAKLSILNNAMGGTFYLDNPSLTFEISNSFGMPLDGHLTSFVAIPASGPNIPITGTIPDPLPINTPASLGQIATSSFTLDKTNTNIASVLNENTKYISYQVNATSNAPVPSYNFLADSSQFKVDVLVNLPLDGYASGLTFQDTIDFKIDNIQQLESASFRLNVTNGFPMQSFTQVYFADSLYNVLDSLISTPADLIIESGVTNSAGLVVQPTHKMADELFDNNRLHNIYNSRKFIIKAVVDSRNAPNQNVKIYSDYKIDVKIGVRAKFNTLIHQ